MLFLYYFIFKLLTEKTENVHFVNFEYMKLIEQIFFFQTPNITL